MENININGDMLERYYELNRMKKEIEQELAHLKRTFNAYFDASVGVNQKGEFLDKGFKLQRQIRKTEKFDDEAIVKKLEELQMEDLIETVRQPDVTKVNAALELGLLREEQIQQHRIRNYSKAIVVKEI